MSAVIVVPMWVGQAGDRGRILLYSDGVTMRRCTNESLCTLTTMRHLDGTCNGSNGPLLRIGEIECSTVLLSHSESCPIINDCERLVDRVGRTGRIGRIDNLCVVPRCQRKNVPYRVIIEVEHDVFTWECCDRRACQRVATRKAPIESL